MNARLSRQTYGKHEVHFSKVLRDENGSNHRFVQLAVDIELQGDFDAAYTEADNRSVIATDTCKNVVHNVAIDHNLASPESFGVGLTKHFVQRYDHVQKASARVRQTLWKTLAQCPHGFAVDASLQPTAEVTTEKGTPPIVRGGVRDWIIAKTTQSGFANFHRDEYRTLPDTDDRILATSLTASWRFSSLVEDHEAARRAVMDALATSFVDHYSHSVQETLMRMGSAALEAVAEIGSITLIMPNKHHIPIDMSAFGRENRNELFTVSPEPYGYIEAEVVRPD